jgi:hypothetical protein
MMKAVQNPVAFFDHRSWNGNVSTRTSKINLRFDFKQESDVQKFEIKNRAT